MKIYSLVEFFPADFDFILSYRGFLATETAALFRENQGGMDFVSGTWFREIITKIRPKAFVESGVWRGYTGHIISQFNDYGAKHYQFDPIFQDANFLKTVKFSCENAIRFSDDYGAPRYSGIGRGATILFDDHQDHLERLLIAYARGAEYALLDDNYINGNGGHASLYERWQDSGVLATCEAVLDCVYVTPPLLSDSSGVSPLLNKNDIPVDLKDDLNDSSYRWLTLVKFKQVTLSSRSQGQYQD